MWSRALLRSSINSIIAIPDENSHHCCGLIMQASQMGANKHPVDAESVGFTPRIGVSRRPTPGDACSMTLPVIERAASVISRHPLPLDCSSALSLLINLRRGRFLTRMIKTPHTTPPPTPTPPPGPPHNAALIGLLSPLFPHAIQLQTCQDVKHPAQIYCNAVRGAPFSCDI